MPVRPFAALFQLTRVMAEMGRKGGRREETIRDIVQGATKQNSPEGLSS